MGIVRRPFTWVCPSTKEKYRIWHTVDIIFLLEEVIEEFDDAQNFFEHYEKACPTLAEHNLAYCINLIKDPDIRQDAFELFMINPKEHMDERGVIRPEQVFETKHGRSSLGLLVDSAEIPRKAVKRK